MEDENYENLYKVLSHDDWKDFRYSHYYEDEDKILKPALEKLGFTNIQFLMGERDSFGPLSRIIRCKDRMNNRRIFVYG